MREGNEKFKSGSYVVTYYNIVAIYDLDTIVQNGSELSIAPSFSSLGFFEFRY